MLVDVIEGDTTFTYRRALADWLRVVSRYSIDDPDYSDEALYDACMAYAIEITPLD